MGNEVDAKVDATPEVAEAGKFVDKYASNADYKISLLSEALNSSNKNLEKCQILLRRQLERHTKDREHFKHRFKAQRDMWSMKLAEMEAQCNELQQQLSVQGDSAKPSGSKLVASGLTEQYMKAAQEANAASQSAADSASDLKVRTKLVKAEVELENLKKQVTQLEQQLKTSQDQLKKKQSLQTDTVRDLELLRAEHQNTTARLKLVTGQLDRARQAAELVQQEVQQTINNSKRELELQRNEAQRSNAGTSARLERAIAEVKQLTSQLEVTTNQLMRAQNQLDQQQDRGAGAREKLAASEKALKKVVKELNQLK